MYAPIVSLHEVFLYDWYPIKIDIRPRPVSIFSDYSATTRTEVTETKFWDKFWNKPITSRDLNNEVARNWTQSQFKIRC